MILRPTWTSPGRVIGPAWPCTGWGLPGRRVTATPVRSYRTFSPLPVHHTRRCHRLFRFCGTFPRVSPGGSYPPPCPSVSGLSSRDTSPAIALTRTTMIDNPGRTLRFASGSGRLPPPLKQDRRGLGWGGEVFRPPATIKPRRFCLERPTVIPISPACGGKSPTLDRWVAAGNPLHRPRHNSQTHPNGWISSRPGLRSSRAPSRSRHNRRRGASGDRRPDSRRRRRFEGR